ncbi:tRNA (guanine-N(7)-)-methyltransferase non-catalytic subunit wuho [Anastrepha ludens]|uniref:tRNA (guanine-N(7)-)-methyltransferase non-catalytic subunit wuho n=1 Tax=Anastrepha ludens TaxID=28586 RepID=UPI0023B1B4B8|nr:tRNA (guanine-N(7)-)-methyltransferase non-catalytic subunit wuho [Anastrepha ludens]
MTTLFYADPELIIALNRKVIFVNPNDLQIFKEIELPEDLKVCGLKTLKDVDEAAEAGGSNEQCKASKKLKEVNIELPSILHVQLSPDRRLCAVTTAGQKAVLLYECHPEYAKLISVRPLARASSALTFSNDSTALLVTDKSGDCYKYDCVNLEDEPSLLLGHLSIVYDAVWTPSAEYIITCDRDDKIRVTNYPETHDIHGYCLGHKEFVSGIALLDTDTIVSVSGDKTLRLWNFISGQEVAKIDLPAPALRICLRLTGEDTFQAAVLLYQPDECIGVYELRKNDADKWVISARAVLQFPEVIVSNICFVNESLYAIGIIDEHFSLKISKLSEKASDVPENWIKMVEEQFKTEVWKSEDVSAWFKKRYDNVSEYLERKKRRIEEKKK